MKYFGTLFASLLLLLTLLSATFTVREDEQVILTQFGRPVGEPIVDAGLHFKLPWIQVVLSFDKRVLEWDGEAKEVTTLDKKLIELDTTARWRISDPLLYLQTSGFEDKAQTKLDDVLDAEARLAIADHVLIEAVRSSDRPMAIEEDLSEGEASSAADKVLIGRRQLAELICERAGRQVERYGIELIDFRIKKINYVQAVRETVYDRMISERQKIAARTRSEGEGERSEVDGLREKKLAEVRSEAYRKAEEIRGKADAEAARIYAEAYGTDPEFYAFVASLEAYGEILDEKTLLMLSTDSELLQYLDGGGD